MEWSSFHCAVSLWERLLQRGMQPLHSLDTHPTGSRTRAHPRHTWAVKNLYREVACKMEKLQDRAFVCPYGQTAMLDLFASSVCPRESIVLILLEAV